MTDSATNTDKFRAILLLAATFGMIAFNWLAAVGRIAGVMPEQISAKYPTPVTPAAWVFTIWAVVYLGMLVFGIYQLLPANLSRFRGIRPIYILSCALNCGWIFMWLSDQIAISLVLIVLLAISLLLINLNIRSFSDYWPVKAPFQIYFGWVTAAILVSIYVLLVHLQLELSVSASTLIAVALILLAAGFGVLIRMSLSAHLYPLAIAWALTAIAVRQSGRTAIVAACALGVVASLIATLSFVVNLPSSETRKK